jgi:hypothetical protein
MKAGQEYNPTDYWPAGSVPGWLCLREGLPAQAKLVYALLTRHAGAELPSEEELARAAGISRRQFVHLVALLKAAEVLKTKRHGPKGISVRFILTADALAEIKALPQYEKFSAHIGSEYAQFSAHIAPEDVKFSSHIEPEPPAPFPPHTPPISPPPAKEDRPHEGASGERAGLDIDRALFDYWSRPATNDEREQVWDAVRQYRANGREVTQAHLDQAAAAAQAWWREKRGGMPRGLKPYLVSLADTLRPESQGPQDDTADLMVKIARLHNFDPQYFRTEMMGYQRQFFIDQAKQRHPEWFPAAAGAN